VADLPNRARVVVVGGGVIGASVAYHLTKLGWSDVLLLEQGTLSCGTTWHAAGLVGPLRASENGTRLVQYSAELYASLEGETGLATGYRNVGGVIVARTEDRMVQLRRTAANAVAYDMPCELVTPEGAQELWQPMRVDDLLGAIWLPGDGKVNPSDLTQSLARGARLGGARIAERVRVTGFTIDDGAVTGVRTDHGDVEAEVVVNAAGQWAKALGDLVGVTVPLHSAEHFYVVTEPVPGVHPDLPIMRDPDGWTYFKEETGGLVVGGFEPEAKPWRSPDDLPHPFEFQLLEEDWDHFSVLMGEALVRIPALAETGIRKFYNGPESFTPDNQFVLGEAPELRGFFVAAGFNSVGIASAGGAGRPGRCRRTTVRALPWRQSVAALPGRGGARAALRRPVAQPGARVRAPATHLAAARATHGRRRPLRHQDGMGAAQRLQPTRGRTGHTRVLLGQALVAALVGG
jgi:glycine/D-amino acid oxidase-like deaminating enzyme